MRIKRDPNSMGLVGIDFGGRWVIRFEEAKKIGQVRCKVHSFKRVLFSQQLSTSHQIQTTIVTYTLPQYSSPTTTTTTFVLCFSPSLLLPWILTMVFPENSQIFKSLDPCTSLSFLLASRLVLAHSLPSCVIRSHVFF